MLIGRRLCSKPGCRHAPAPGRRYCKPCFAQASRVSHGRHRAERNGRRRDRSSERTEAARVADIARAKVAVAVARGTIIREPCIECGGTDRVTAYIASPTQWRAVVWVCREDRAELIARRTAPQKPDPAPSWQADRAAALAAIEALPDAERVALHAIAARGPVGIRLTPDAPLFTIQLVQAYQKSRGPT